MTKHVLWLTALMTVVAAFAVPAAPAARANVDLLSLVACKPTKATKTKPRIATVIWKTATEPQMLGFNIYRKVGSKITKLNRAVIGSRGQVSGATYTWRDRLPKTVKGVPCYRLEAVGSTGTKTLLRSACSKTRCANLGV